MKHCEDLLFKIPNMFTHCTPNKNTAVKLNRYEVRMVLRHTYKAIKILCMLIMSYTCRKKTL